MATSTPSIAESPISFGTEFMTEPGGHFIAATDYDRELGVNLHWASKEPVEALQGVLDTAILDQETALTSIARTGHHEITIGKTAILDAFKEAPAVMTGGEDGMFRFDGAQLPVLGEVAIWGSETRYGTHGNFYWNRQVGLSLPATGDLTLTRELFEATASDAARPVFDDMVAAVAREAKRQAAW